MRVNRSYRTYEGLKPERAPLAAHRPHAGSYRTYEGLKLRNGPEVKLEVVRGSYRTYEGLKRRPEVAGASSPRWRFVPYL